MLLYTFKPTHTVYLDDSKTRVERPPDLTANPVLWPLCNHIFDVFSRGVLLHMHNLRQMLTGPNFADKCAHRLIFP